MTFCDDFAEVMKSHIGEQYIPSNGTEGAVFISEWCEHCARDKPCSEGKDFFECDDSEVCDILAASYRGEATEWVIGKDGQPKCTAFVQAGHPVPLRDDLTMDMFSNEPQRPLAE